MAKTTVLVLSKMAKKINDDGCVCMYVCVWHSKCSIFREFSIYCDGDGHENGISVDTLSRQD